MLSSKEEFKPLSMFKGGHNQTIMGALTSFPLSPPSITKHVQLPDHDVLAMEVTTPKKWTLKDPTVVLIHGLCGSHKSNYLVRIARKLYNTGIQSIRINLRGCGSGRGLARYIYHSGSSEDVNYALKEIKRLFPDSPISLVGFSLGANIVLKLAGELSSAAGQLFKHVIAVSPPADLRASVLMLDDPKNRMYGRYFIRLLRQDVHFRHERFNLPKVVIPMNMSIFEFDEYYVAPQIGFKSALDYYASCGSKKLIPAIEVPCYILFAEDDPIINAYALDDLTLPEHIKVIKTKEGGHLGFFGSPFHIFGIRWMDNILIKWIGLFNPKELP